MFKPKTQSFRREIRRDYLTDYFRKKRKQFTSIPNTNQSENLTKLSLIEQKVKIALQQNHRMIPEKGLTQVTLEDLVLTAKFSETQLGVQTLKLTEIPTALLPYFSPTFYNTRHQYLATATFANITFIKSEVSPSTQFMRNIINIIENTDTNFQFSSNDEYKEQSDFRKMMEDLIDNCVLIIYNLIHDFTEAMTFYINECGLLDTIFSMLQSGGLYPCTIERVLKVMIIVNEYFKNKKEGRPVKKFLKSYISVFLNSNDPNLLNLAILNIKYLFEVYIEATQPEEGENTFWRYDHTVPNSKTHDTKQEYHEVITQVTNSRILQKLTSLYPYASAMISLTKNAFFVIKILITRMEKDLVQKRLFPLLRKMFDAIYRQDHFQNHHEAQNNFVTSKIQKNQEQTVMQVMETRALFYQIIYALLQIWSSDHIMLVKDSLYEKIVAKYLEFEDINATETAFTQDTREYFIEIFGMLVYSEMLNLPMRNMLRVSIERWRLSEEAKERDNTKDNASFESFLSDIQKAMGAQTQTEQKDI